MESQNEKKKGKEIQEGLFSMRELPVCILVISHQCCTSGPSERNTSELHVHVVKPSIPGTFTSEYVSGCLVWISLAGEGVRILKIKATVRRFSLYAQRTVIDWDTVGKYSLVPSHKVLVQELRMPAGLPLIYRSFCHIVLLNIILFVDGLRNCRFLWSIGLIQATLDHTEMSDWAHGHI